jgi:site-specific DNA-cytosine methylase
MKKKTPCIDLFTGIGGIPLALHEAVQPKAYCEIDPVAQNILTKQMQAKRLPKAPLAPDITTFHLKPSHGIKLICGGFPCQGVSSAGSRTGMQHTQTGLFSHILRLADEGKVDAIFLENVASIICTPGMWKSVTQSLHKKGFDLAWTIFNASQLGTPMLRKRWWGLAIRRGTNAHQTLSPVTLKRFVGNEPKGLARCIPDVDERRLGRLGNAVCPLQCRLAWNTLLQAWNQPGGKDGVHFLKNGKGPSDVKSDNPLFVPPSWTRDWNLVLNTKNAAAMRKVFQYQTGCKSKRTCEESNQIYKKTHWNTPRCSRTTWYGANFPSTRTVHELATQIRFERNTPLSQRHPSCKPNPEFIEWMMGFPRKWTAQPQAGR